MDEEELNKQIQEAESALAEAEKALGPDDPGLVDGLSKLALLLHQDKRRILEAVNVEARARTIRAKVYASQVKSDEASAPPPPPPSAPAKPVKKRKPIGLYTGLAAIVLAFWGIFIGQEWSRLLTPLCLVLAVADVVVSGGQWWRAVACFLLLGWTWYGIKCMPDEMLVASSPMERLAFQADHHALVDNIRKLGPDTAILVYSMRLPATYTQVAKGVRTDWGSISVWQGQTQPDGSAPQIAFVAVRVPEDIQKKVAGYSVLKAAKEVVMPRYKDWLKLATLTTDPGEEDEINGRDFGILRWSGVLANEQGDEESGQHMRGVIYVAREKNTLIAIAAADSATYADESLESMEACPQTLRKLKPGEGEI